ncbi:hypothetical protein MRY82_06320 [bacterium]|nr:hypothetical protein [bacterium]
MDLKKVKSDRLFLPFILTTAFSYVPSFIDVFQSYVSWLDLLGNIYAVITAALLLAYLAFTLTPKPKVASGIKSIIKLVNLLLILAASFTVLYTFVLIAQGRSTAFGPFFPIVAMSVLFAVRLKLKTLYS